MRRWVAAFIVVVAFVGCGESEEERNQRRIDELQQQMDDYREEAFLDCIERANDNLIINDPPFGCRR